MPRKPHRPSLAKGRPRFSGVMEKMESRCAAAALEGLQAVVSSGAGEPGSGEPGSAIELSIAKNIAASGTQPVTVPVKLKVLNGTRTTVSGIDLVIEYSDNVMQVGNFRIGSLLGTPFSLSVNTQTPGILRVTLAAAEGPVIPNQTSGSVFEFDVTMRAGVPDGTYPLNLRSDFETTVTSVADNQIDLQTMQPAPTNAATDAIDGSIVFGAVAGWTNPSNALDVDNNGRIEPIDALLVINELNSPKFSDGAGKLVPRSSVTLDSDRFFDTTGDGSVAPLDALLVINRLNAPGS